MVRRYCLIVRVLAGITSLLLLTHSVFAQYGSPVTVPRWVTADFELHDVAVGPQFNGGLNVDVTPASVTLPVWASCQPGGTYPWNDMLSWSWQNGGVNWFIVTYNISQLVYDFTQGGGSTPIYTYSLGTQTFEPFYSDIVSGFTDRGSTERTLSIPWSVPVEVYGVYVGEVSFDLLVKYNVFIENGRSIYLDQNAKVRSVNIGAGSSLLVDDEHFLTVDDVVNNSGTIQKLGSGLWTWNVPVNNLGTMEVYGGVMEHAGGGSFRDGTVSLSDGAILQFTSLVNLYGDNTFNGPGTVYLPSSGVLHLESGATVHGGAPFVVDGGQLSGQGSDSAFASDTNLRFVSGSVGGDAGVAIGGSFDWLGGSTKGTLFNVGNDLVIRASGEKRIEPSSALINMGTIRQVGDATVTMGGFYLSPWSYGATIDNQTGAIYDLQGDGDIVLGGVVQTMDGPVWPSAGANSIMNHGTFRKSAGGGESVVEARLYNYGTTEVLSGTMRMQGGLWDLGGVLSVADGAKLDLPAPSYEYSQFYGGSTTITGPGAVEFSGGAVRARGGSTMTATGGAQLLIDGGELLANGPEDSILIRSDASVRLESGAAGGSTFIVEGAFDWRGGAIRGTFWQGSYPFGGGGVVNAGTDFLISGPDEKRLEGDAVLTNRGTIRQDGESAVSMYGFYSSAWGGRQAVIDNRAGAAYDLSGDGDIVLGVLETGWGPQRASSEWSKILNQGTFRKSAGTGESVIEPSFNDAGLLEVDSGTLILKGGGQFTGSTVTVSEGANLRLESRLGAGGDNTFSGLGVIELPGGGALSLGSGATVHGGAPVLIDGGQVTGSGLDSLFASDTHVRFLSGLAGGDAGVAVAGSFDWLGGSVGGKLFNIGNGLVISGAAEKRIEPSGTLTNMGTIR